MSSKGADQTAQMCRLIYAFVVRKWYKQVLWWCASDGVATLPLYICYHWLLSEILDNVPPQFIHFLYHNDAKFLDRQIWANSVDTDQTAPAIPRASYGVIAL